MIRSDKLTIATLSTALVGAVLVLLWLLNYTFTNYQLEGATLVTRTAVTSEEVARAHLDSIGGSEVKIVLTDDERNCGIWNRDRTVRTDVHGACFSELAPDTVYLSTQLPTDDDTRYLVTHEYQHYLQFTNSNFDTKVRTSGSPDVECLADVETFLSGSATRDQLFYFSFPGCESFEHLLE